jgi:hypothetical protein
VRLNVGQGHHKGNWEFDLGNFESGERRKKTSNIHNTNERQLIFIKGSRIEDRENQASKHPYDVLIAGRTT